MVSPERYEEIVKDLYRQIDSRFPTTYYYDLEDKFLDGYFTAEQLHAVADAMEIIDKLVVEKDE